MIILLHKLHIQKLIKTFSNDNAICIKESTHGTTFSCTSRYTPSQNDSWVGVPGHLTLGKRQKKKEGEKREEKNKRRGKQKRLRDNIREIENLDHS